MPGHDFYPLLFVDLSMEALEQFNSLWSHERLL